MKKLLLVGFLLFVTYGMVYSGALLGIISPNGGENWPIGSEKTIRWSADERLTNNVKLILFRNEMRVGLIAKDLSPRKGFYTWKKAGQYQGGTAKPGSGYKIRIKEQGGTAMDESDKPFSLTLRGKGLGLKPRIKVTNPKKGDKWKEGETRIIWWESILKPPFKVELYNSYWVLIMECTPTEVKRPILAGPNKHMMGWKITQKSSVFPGDFYIRVSKGTAFGFSGRFHIDNSYNVPQ